MAVSPYYYNHNYKKGEIMGQHVEPPPAHELQQHRQEGASYEVLGIIYGVSSTTVRKWLKGYGLFKPTRGGTALEVPPRDVIEKAYEDGGSKVKAGLLLGVSETTFSTWMIARDVHSTRLGRKRTFPLPDRREFLEFIKTSTIYAAAKHYNVSPSTITTWKRTLGVCKVIKSNSIPVPSRTELEAAWSITKRKVLMARHFGVSTPTLRSWITVMKPELT